MVTGLSSSLLSAWFTARSGASAGGGGGLTATAAAAETAGLSGAGAKTEASGVLPPWDPRGEIAELEGLRRSVLANGEFFDGRFGDFSDIEASDDEKSLFAMYRGVRRLQSIAAAAMDKGASDFDRAYYDRRFQEGVAQLGGFFDDLSLEGVSVVQGEQLTEFQSGLKVSRGGSSYTGGIVHSGAYDAEVDAFQGDVRFDITVRKNGVDNAVAIDLADMGTTPRTLDNVADHINAQLEANGFLTRFERVKIGEPDENGIIQGDNFGFQVNGIITERVSFAPATGTGAPALFMAGVSGAGEEAAGQLSRIVDLAGGGTTVFSRRIEAAPTVTETTSEDGETITSETSNPLEVMATARGADGGIYVVGKTSAAVDGQAIKGESDLVVVRYDSNGKEVFTRTLGAAGEAEGASVAVDADGNVIVAGSVEGELGGTNKVGGDDSVVVKYNADGVEQWTRRFGGLADDRANHVSVGSDGTIYVAGEANSSIGGVANQGGRDGYLRALDADGNTLYTRAAGAGTGTESAKATAIAADGGLIVATEEDGRAVLTKYAAGDDGTGAPVWSLDLGDLDGGRIGGIAVDAAGDIYLAGAAGAGFAPGTVVDANAGGRDAVLVKVSDGASASVDYATFLGTPEDNSAAGVAVENGTVYLTGKTSAALPGGEQNGDRNAFAAGFDAATGARTFVQQVSGRGGLSSGAGIVVDPTGDSALNKLGLPAGALSYSDSRVVTDRSSVRPGDHFYVSVDGGRKQKITIDDDDTIRSLTFKLNAVLLFDGTADVRRALEGDQLTIKPKEGVTIELLPGTDGEDALKGLGLSPGAVSGKVTKDDGDSTSAAPKVFALELPEALSVADRDSAAAANEALVAAMGKIQRAYRYLTQDPELRELLEGPQAGKRGGPVPAYLSSQIANYEAGLARLQSGGGGGGTLALF
ncbi:hypothetical protein DDZ18_07780 [Marinicauda salina]|uniref:Regulatory protein FlaEY n=2 Tax=Marinicauda salina TaxID=2135793 RepID=A0A2U2BU92_9PROT|nr:hypothetical protein DDZ18_07780 [Marinicauda salina]